MPHPEQHTIVRFSLRSLLAITFGVAVVMAVAGPSIRALPAPKQKHLLYALIAVVGGMVCTVAIAIRNRLRLGEKCGKLLVALELKRPSKKNWSKWSWLVISFPLTVLFFFPYIDKALSEDRGVLSVAANLVFPFLMSTWLARQGLAVWAEGYSNAIELCEQGIVIGEDFYEWNNPALRQMYWTTNAESLLVNINREPISVPVPLQHREAIDAIIEHYFNTRTIATDQI